MLTTFSLSVTWNVVGVAYCDAVLGLQFTPGLKQGWILADIQCTFHQQLQFPCSIEVATRISRSHTSSAELVAAIFKRGSDGLILSSHVLTFWFNYEKLAKVEVALKLADIILYHSQFRFYVHR